MLFIKLALLASTASATGLASRSTAPQDIGEFERGESSSAQTADVYYTHFATDTPDTVVFKSAYDVPSFEVTWSFRSGLVEAGKGWGKGSNRTIAYTGVYKPSGHSLLGVMGWTRNPLVQYMIIDNYGSLYPAAGAVRAGNVTTDGTLYTISTELVRNQQSIDGSANFTRYWSVRRNLRTGGTITTNNHFEAFERNGMVLGKHDYQLVYVEGYYSSGTASLSFEEI
jgi:endo-1,4-beta-xylanase